MFATKILYRRIGSGTGIFTRALLAHPKWSDIKAVKAIEPSAGMRDVFSQTVEDDRVTVSEGTFEETGVDDKWADVVIIAQVSRASTRMRIPGLNHLQAFHWCPDFDRASAEFSRILKPDGAVIFIWNLEDRYASQKQTLVFYLTTKCRAKARWVAQIRDHIEQHEHGTPQFRLGLWRQAFDTPSYKQAFLPPKETTWSYELTATTETALDRAATKSYIAILPEEEKLKVRAFLKTVVEKGDDKVWIDESKDTFQYPYQTFVVVSQKK